MSRLNGSAKGVSSSGASASSSSSSVVRDIKRRASANPPVDDVGDVDVMEGKSMQQRQFSRLKDGIALDIMEEGASNSLQYSNGHANGRGTAQSFLNGLTEMDVDEDTTASMNIKKHGDSLLNTADSSSPTAGLTDRDKRAMVLLVALYLLQGIPVGLAFGSIPYLLRSKLSYSQIGIFTLCTYPYSLKLLWSPVVDSIFSTRLGRRKSWIVPIQLIVGMMLWWLSRNVDAYMDKEVPDVRTLTGLFFTLVFFAATQGGLYS